MNTADELRTIASVAEDAPDAVLLARLASPAIRIEPHLLRLLRTRLLPEADVSAEADLWFSPLVESAGADSIVLEATVAEILRADLAAESDLFERTTILIRDAHGHLPPALRLEEEVTAIALSGAPDSATRIDAALATALRTLTADPERAKETARWFARAWPRLPDAVRRTRSAATLALAAGLLTGRRGRTALVDATASIDDVRWVFREQSFTEFDRIDAVMQGDTVVFTEAGASGGMRVPRTDPRVVELRVGEIEGYEPLLVDASPGTAVSVPPEASQVTLTTLAGDVYELERVAAPGAGDVAVAAPDGEPPWIDISPYRTIADACVLVRAGETAYRIQRTGVRVTSAHVVTAREPLVFEEVLVVEPAAIGSTARPRPDIESPLLVIEATGPNAIGFSTPPLIGAADEPGQTPLTTRAQDVILIGHRGQELRAIAGTTVIDDPMAAGFPVVVESAVPLPDEFAGGPVIIANRVCGIVTAIEPAEAADAWVIAVASGTAMRQALAAATDRGAEQQSTTATDVEAEPGADSEAGVAQAVSPESPLVASGNRIAKIVIVARDLEVAREAVHALADRVVETGQAAPRKGVSWNVEVRGAPDLRAGIVFWAARGDLEWWPLVLDLRDAALVVVVDQGLQMKGREGDEAWADSIHATIRSGAPHVPAVNSSQLSGLTGMPFPSPEPGPLRDTLFGMIHWAAQPELDAGTWESAPELAFQTPTSGPVGHAREHISLTGRWDEDIDRWLRILTGGRVVESADIVFRDPDWFELLVGGFMRAVRSEQAVRGLPGVDLFSVENILTVERLMDKSRMPVAPQSVVRAAAAVLRDAGLAVLIETDYGTVIVVPAFALDESGLHRAARGHRVMSASWTGDVRSGFFAIAAAFEWSDGRIEELGWRSQTAEGVARVERDGRYRIDGTQSGQIADIVVTQEEESATGYSDRPLAMVRRALEEALADNRSLSIREDRMLA